jgi:hypothetical protein
VLLILISQSASNNISVISYYYFNEKCLEVLLWDQYFVTFPILDVTLTLLNLTTVSMCSPKFLHKMCVPLKLLCDR